MLLNAQNLSDNVYRMMASFKAVVKRSEVGLTLHVPHAYKMGCKQCMQPSVIEVAV